MVNRWWWLLAFLLVETQHCLASQHRTYQGSPHFLVVLFSCSFFVICHVSSTMFLFFSLSPVHQFGWFLSTSCAHTKTTSVTTSSRFVCRSYDGHMTNLSPFFLVTLIMMIEIDLRPVCFRFFFKYNYQSTRLWRSFQLTQDSSLFWDLLRNEIFKKDLRNNFHSSF